MPVSYTVTEKGAFVHLTATGRVGGEEFIAQVQAMAADDRIAPGYSKLSDLTGATALELGPDFFEKMVRAEEKNQLAHRLGRMAIVVNRADYFDLARQYERTVAPLGMTVIVFNHCDTALLWLGRGKTPGYGVRDESRQPRDDVPGSSHEAPDRRSALGNSRESGGCGRGAARESSLRRQGGVS